MIWHHLTPSLALHPWIFPVVFLCSSCLAALFSISFVQYFCYPSSAHPNHIILASLTLHSLLLPVKLLTFKDPTLTSTFRPFLFYGWLWRLLRPSSSLAFSQQWHSLHHNPAGKQHRRRLLLTRSVLSVLLMICMFDLSKILYPMPFLPPPPPIYLGLGPGTNWNNNYQTVISLKI